MCFSKPKIPDPKPIPPTPKVDDDAVRNRARREEDQLRRQSGSAATFSSDLAPSDVTGQRKVLLGQ